jgi:hypothetical protein
MPVRFMTLMRPHLAPLDIARHAFTLHALTALLSHCSVPLLSHCFMPRASACPAKVSLMRLTLVAPCASLRGNSLRPP